MQITWESGYCSHQVACTSDVPQLRVWCSSAASICIWAPNAATAPSMNFWLNCPFLYGTQDITPWCGNMNRPFFSLHLQQDRLILFLYSFSQSSWKIIKSQINSLSQIRLLPCLKCNLVNLLSAADNCSFLSSCSRWSKASTQRILPSPPPPFLNYQIWKQHLLQAFSCQVHISCRVKDFSNFQEHHLLRHLPLYYIMKQEPSHGSNFWTTGTPAAGNGKPACLTGLKWTFLLPTFLFLGLQHFG